MTEKVMVFDASMMKGFKDLPGFSTNDDDVRHMLDCITNSTFIDRDNAEQDENYKQIIPYLLVRKAGKVLAYRRSKQSGEGRLHDKWSVGIGGHINTDDCPKSGYSVINGLTAFCHAIDRELMEELEWDEVPQNEEPIGMIYDDENEVGRVHIGYAYFVNVDKDSEFPKKKEDTIAEMKWLTPQEASKLPNLEGWSKIVLEAITSAEDKKTGD